MEVLRIKLGLNVKLDIYGNKNGVFGNNRKNLGLKGLLKIKEGTLENIKGDTKNENVAFLEKAASGN